MIEKTITLKNYDSVKEFIDIANSKPYDIELMYKTKTVNAKDAGSVFSLDLTKPLVMVAHCQSSGELLMQVKKFLYEDK